MTSRPLNLASRPFSNSTPVTSMESPSLMPLDAAKSYTPMPAAECESLLNPLLRAESPAAAGRPNLPRETIELVAQPFGNSTRQNRISGLEPTAATWRPRDRHERLLEHTD